MTNTLGGQSRCYLWNFSIASILILTFSNILLTIRLLHKNSDLIPLNNNNNNNGIDTNNENNNGVDQQPASTKQNRNNLCNSDASSSSSSMDENTKKNSHINTLDQINQTNYMKNFNFDYGRWDSQRLYKLFDNIFIGQKYIQLSNVYNVCLATQSSVERLSSLVQVAMHWTGPISVSVYAAGNEELNILFLYIYYLQKCYDQIREQILFHLLVPKDNMPNKINLNFTYLSQLDCENPGHALQTLLKLRTVRTIKWRLRNPYPQNHLRNLARKNCQTNYIFLTDVDIIPSYGLADGLNDFLKVAECRTGLCAYVIPTYELDERVKFPPNKTDLLRLSKKGLAQPFHEKIFIYNQFATNISRWQQHTDPSNGKVHVSHPVTNFEFFYEPFYVASDTVPQHDERFLGYGFTRNTQVYEMFVAGYKFFVLSPVFTCHWGLQLKRSRPHWRERQNTLNAKKFEVFKREIFARYNVDPLNMMKTNLKTKQSVKKTK